MSISLAVWSSIPRSGKTVFTFLFARRLAQMLGKNASILTCCTCMADGLLMDLSGAGRNHPGLEDLVNAGIPFKNNNINVKALLSNTENLYFIGSSKSTPSFVLRNARGYTKLLDHLRQVFDIIIFDTSSYEKNPLTRMVLENCDHVLNIVVQDLQMLDLKPCSTGKDLACIVNMHRNIYPGKKELSSMYNMKNIHTLPCCSQLLDMKNRQMMEQYAQLDTEYIQEIEKLIRFLAQTLNLPIEQNRKNTGLINLLRKGAGR